jgi:D-glycero-D-manno-heptose 1,7-bisphosphate phosphatase
MMRKALFLDRDGIINEDRGYVIRPTDFLFIDGIFNLCRAAMESDFEIIVVTNQAGIARGFYTERDFVDLTKWMLGRFEKQGVVIQKVYYSPFHPTSGIGEYRKDSFCRKPNPGMILAARDEFGFNLSRSMLLGDKMSDIEAGQRAGVRLNIMMTTNAPAAAIRTVETLWQAIPLLSRS